MNRRSLFRSLFAAAIAAPIVAKIAPAKEAFYSLPLTDYLTDVDSWSYSEDFDSSSLKTAAAQRYRYSFQTYPLGFKLDKPAFRKL